jgi:hypothetical protein
MISTSFKMTKITSARILRIHCGFSSSREVVAPLKTLKGDRLVKANAAEEAIFEKIRGWCRRDNMNITVRVAGGWVRDRLLGKEHSPDLDLVMDKMNPSDFLKNINKLNAVERRPRLRFVVVKRNPEKLKFAQPGDTISFFGDLLTAT